MDNFWLFTINIFVAGMIMILALKKVDILEWFAKLVFYYFGEYILISSGFFLIDKFKVERVQLFMLILNVALLGYLYYKNKIKNNNELELLKPKKPLFVIVLIIATIFSFNKFEFFGMGQDEGVYQTKAIQLVYGDSSRQLDFEEYSGLATDSQKEDYSDFVLDLLGFDNYDSHKPFLSDSDEMSEVSGIFHGIPTFPAILALAISVFGIENMLIFQSVFFIAFAIMVKKIADNLNLSELNSYVVLAIAAMSPIVLWVSKSSLTEMFLTLIFTFLIYYFTSSKPSSIILTSIPILVFSFFHISIYTIMPEIVVLYWLLFINTRNKTYLRANYLALLFFTIGYLFMLYITPEYSFNNSRPMYFGPLNHGNLIPFVLGVVVLCGVITFLLGKFGAKFKFEFTNNKVLAWLVKLVVAAVILYTAYYAYKLVSGMLPVENSSQAGYYGKLGGIKNLTLSAYVYMTGLLALPLGLLFMFFKTRIFLKDNKRLIITFLFIYNILITSTFMRIEILHYYYYARYVAPFVLIIALAYAIYCEYLPKGIVLAILIVATGFNGYYGYVMLDNDDDSKMSYNIMTQVFEDIGADSAVILTDSRISRLFALPLKSLAATDVYPIFSEGVESTIDYLSDKYSNVYLLTDSEIDYLDFDNRVISKGSYLTSQDLNEYRYRYVPLPLAFSQQEVEITLMKMETPKNIYLMNNPEVIQDGFGDIEGDFRWTNSSEVIINVYLEQNNYDLVINQLPIIPFDAINTKNLEVEVYFNDTLINTVSVNSQNDSDPIVSSIARDVVEDGKNEVKLILDTWSPTELGLVDNRTLGIAIQSLEFIER